VLPALQREPGTDFECGHVMGFRIDSALDVLLHAAAARRFWRSLADRGL